MRRFDVPVQVGNLPTLPAAGTNTGGILRSGGVTYVDRGGVYRPIDGQTTAGGGITSVAGATPGDQTLSLSQFNERTPAAYPATLLSTDGIVYMGSSSANTLTVQTAATGGYATAQVVNVVQTGTGKTQIVAASGVTFINPGSLYLRTKGSALTLKRMGSTDTWIVIGDTDDAVAGGTTTKIQAKAKYSGGNFAIGSGGFNTLPLDTFVFNVGGWALSSNALTVPTTGYYDVTAVARIQDSSSPRNVGFGVGTSNADSGDFYWDSNNGSGSYNRRTFQYHNIMSFSSGDVIRYFAYDDVGGSYGAMQLTLNLIG